MANNDLLAAADGLKATEANNHLGILVDVLRLATESKNLMEAKEKMISS